MKKEIIIDKEAFDSLFCCIFNMGRDCETEFILNEEQIRRTYMNVIEWEAEKMSEFQRRLMDYLSNNNFTLFNDIRIKITNDFPKKTFIKK